jgi:hypothetical protein
MNFNQIRNNDVVLAELVSDKVCVRAGEYLFLPSREEAIARFAGRRSLSAIELPKAVFQSGVSPAWPVRCRPGE